MNKKAFTGIELIIVITILVILSTIAFISLAGITTDSKNSLIFNEFNSKINKKEKILSINNIDCGYVNGNNNIYYCEQGSSLYKFSLLNNIKIDDRDRYIKESILGKKYYNNSEVVNINELLSNNVGSFTGVYIKHILDENLKINNKFSNKEKELLGNLLLGNKIGNNECYIKGFNDEGKTLFSENNCINILNRELLIGNLSDNLFFSINKKINGNYNYNYWKDTILSFIGGLFLGILGSYIFIKITYEPFPKRFKRSMIEIIKNFK